MYGFQDSADNENPAKEKYRRDGHHERRAYRDRAEHDKDDAQNQKPSPISPEFPGAWQLNGLSHCFAFLILWSLLALAR